MLAVNYFILYLTRRPSWIPVKESTGGFVNHTTIRIAVILGVSHKNHRPNQTVKRHHRETAIKRELFTFIALFQAESDRERCHLQFIVTLSVGLSFCLSVYAGCCTLRLSTSIIWTLYKLDSVVDGHGAVNLLPSSAAPPSLSFERGVQKISRPPTISTRSVCMQEGDCMHVLCPVWYATIQGGQSTVVLSVVAHRGR